jgi:large subunit ribosomal protein L4
MAANLLTVEAAQQANLNLTEGTKGHGVIHQAVVTYRANRRVGTASTKTRNEVSGSGKKPWNQKGTGRARIGSVRAPHWRGGGVVFGPRPRDYSKKINVKMKQLALRSSLTARIKDGDVLVSPELKIADGKTKSFIKALAGITTARKVLLVSAQFDPLTERAARNVPKVDLVLANAVNCENLLNYDKIILLGDALETLAKRTAALA